MAKSLRQIEELHPGKQRDGQPGDGDDRRREVGRPGALLLGSGDRVAERCDLHQRPTEKS